MADIRQGGPGPQDYALGSGIKRVQSHPSLKKVKPDEAYEVEIRFGPRKREGDVWIGSAVPAFADEVFAVLANLICKNNAPLEETGGVDTDISLSGYRAYERFPQMQGYAISGDLSGYRGQATGVTVFIMGRDMAEAYARLNEAQYPEFFYEKRA